jgi:hypothetical protein
VGRLSTNFSSKAPKSKSQMTLLSNLEKIKNLKPLSTQRFTKRSRNSTKNGAGTPDLLPSLNISHSANQNYTKNLKINRFDDSIKEKNSKIFLIQNSYKEFMELEDKLKEDINPKESKEALISKLKISEYLPSLQSSFAKLKSDQRHQNLISAPNSKEQSEVQDLNKKRFQKSDSNDSSNYKIEFGNGEKSTTNSLLNDSQMDIEQKITMSNL